MNFAKIAAVTSAVLNFALSANSAMAASCQNVSMQAERKKLAAFLVRGGMHKSQVVFLTNGAVRRANELPKTGLNERGKSCGIAPVRATVIGCLNAIVPGSRLSSARTSKSSWGKSNLTQGEMLVVGLFHTCRASAMESFYAR